MTFVVGLTGGIGSGKSMAAEHFRHLGATVIDTDIIAHQLTAQGGAAIPSIREACGAAVINQTAPWTGRSCANAYLPTLPNASGLKPSCTP